MEYGFLCCTSGPYLLSILYIVVHIHQSQSSSLSLTPDPLVTISLSASAVASTAGRDRKWLGKSNTVWEKATGDRIKVLKMGPGTQDLLLGSRALFLGAASLLFSVLAHRKHLVLRWSWPPVSLVTPPILLITLNCLCYFRVQGLSLLEIIDPHIPWGNLVCAQAVCWTCADQAFQGPHDVFFLSLAGHDDPKWSTWCTFIWVMLYCYILFLFFSHGDFLMA